MEQPAIMNNVVSNTPSTKRKQTVPDPDLSVPERGATGPVPIGQVMEPLQRIIEHPDRNRLLAEFFKRHW